MKKNVKSKYNSLRDMSSLSSTNESVAKEISLSHFLGLIYLVEMAKSYRSAILDVLRLQDGQHPGCYDT